MLCCSTSQKSGERGRKKSIFLAYIKKKKENNFSDLKILHTAISILAKKYSYIKLRSQVKYEGPYHVFLWEETPPPPPLYSFCLSSTVSFCLPSQAL